MLVDGFDRVPTIVSSYKVFYYDPLIVSCGFIKVVYSDKEIVAAGVAMPFFSRSLAHDRKRCKDHRHGSKSSGQDVKVGHRMDFALGSRFYENYEGAVRSQQ